MTWIADHLSTLTIGWVAGLITAVLVPKLYVIAVWVVNKIKGQKNG